MLELKDVYSGYEGVPVLFGMTLHVGIGEVVALMGRNGMGKSTTVRTIFGIPTARCGKITFEGNNLIGKPVHRIAQYGVTAVPETRGIFSNLTVYENLIATSIPRKNGWTLQDVHELFPNLAERSQHLGSQLSGGEQQMLAIGRALMTNPRLLILDEATEGLAPTVRTTVWEALTKLKRAGQSILVIDKHLSALTRIADRFYIVEKGAIVWSGTNHDVIAGPQQVTRYLSV